MENKDKEFETEINETEINETVLSDLSGSDETVELSESMENEKIDVNKKVKKKMPKWKKTILIILIVLLSLVLIAIGTYFVMRAMGKESLFEKTKGKQISEDRLVEKVESGVIGIDTSVYEDDPEDEGDKNKDDKKYVGIASENDISKIQSDIQEKIEQIEIDPENLGDKKEHTKEEIKEKLDKLIEDKKNNKQESETGDKNEKPSEIIVSDSEEYDIIYNGEKYKYNDDMINILLLGIDKYHEVRPAANGLSGGQSDVILLLAMNPKTKIVDIIAVPRDTIARVSIYDEDGNFAFDGYTQICLQHGYGDAMSLSNERAKNAISYLFYNLPINTVSSLNIAGVGALNDAIGGVTVDALQDFSYNGIDYKQGDILNLKGELAMNYVLFRDCNRHYTALERLARQKQYLYKFVEKVFTAIKDDPSVVLEIYDILSRYVVTDLSASEMVYLASEAAGYTFGDIKVLEGTVDTSWTYERYYLDEDAFKELVISEFYEKVK